MVPTIEPEVIAAASERLLQSVASLADAEWPGDTHCTGWTRAHVIAHIALNGEALAGVLEGLRDGNPTTMYVSNERRDADIDELAGQAPDAIRIRLQSAVDRFADAWSGPAVDDVEFERTPGGQRMRAGAIGYLRLREVEIHHADLKATYSWTDWPQETVQRFLDSSARQYAGPGFRAETDIGAWEFGDVVADSPTVTGRASALAWWATGRDPGPVLSSTEGTLPTMEGR